MTLHRAGAVDQAEAIYREMLREDPGHAGAWHLLGVVLHSRRDFPGAVEHIEKALSLCEHKAVYWNNYGAILKDIGQFAEAKVAFERALSIRDEYPDAWSNLGLVQIEFGNLDEAEKSIRHALRLDPHHADALRHLAVAYREKGEFEEALRLCRKAAAVGADGAEIHELEGGILATMKRFEEAVSAYSMAISCDPDVPDAHLNQGAAYTDLGDTENAGRAFEQAARLRPDRPMWRLRHLSLCPTVFGSGDETTEYRVSLERQLDEALADPPSFDWRNALRDGFPPPFQLAFHGVCNRQIKEKFARLFSASFPQDRPRSRGRAKTRVGFLCTRNHEGGFVRGFGGIMQRLDRRRFEVVGLVSHDVLPFCRRNVPADGMRWVGFPHHVELAWRTIRETECDVIIHWHAGSDVLNYFLPFLPLAPSQSIGFGANGTTGIPNINHFISSRLFERGEDAEEDYTEQLVQFGGLTTWQARPHASPGATRAGFGLPPSGTIYFCPQQLGKFDPQFDVLLRRVLEEDANGRIVILKGRRRRVAEALRARLRQNVGGTLSKRIILLPEQRPSDYYHLLGLADVVLDAPSFSASLTGFDALSAGRAIVTLPGQQMAQRYVLGFYKHMALTDLIVTNELEYVDLAVQLGQNAAYRDVMQTEILSRCDALYEDARVIDSYESFFEQAIQQH